MIVIRRRGDWRPWLFGAWAAAATAALIVLPSTGLLDRRPPPGGMAGTTSLEGGAGTSGAPNTTGAEQAPADDQAISIGVLDPPLELGSATRGDTADVDVFYVRPGTRSLSLRIPERSIPAGGSLDVILTREGAPVVRAKSERGASLRTSRNLFVMVKKPLEPGRYRLTLVGATEDSAHRSETEFELRLAEP